MPRQSRVVVPGIAHHITQRGNYRRNIFQEKKDYEIYSNWINEYSQCYEMDVLAYCLMSNHVHFIVIPHRDDSLSRVFNAVHMRYAQYINRRNKMQGHLWQGRFYSCILDDQHLFRGLRYVERNPVRAKMVTEAWGYVWSSAGEHVGIRESLIMLSKINGIMNIGEWKEFLREGDRNICEDIRLKTRRGFAVGSEVFIRELEEKVGRSLGCLQPGRPRKAE